MPGLMTVYINNGRACGAPSVLYQIGQRLGRYCGVEPPSSRYFYDESRGKIGASQRTSAKAHAISHFTLRLLHLDSTNVAPSYLSLVGVI